MEIRKAIDYFLGSLSYDGHSKHTIKAYKQDLYQWKQTINKEILDDLTYEDFEAYFLELHQLELKTTSLRRKRVVLNRFMKYCYDKKFCKEKYDTYIDPIKLKQQKKPKEVLTTQDLATLFSAIDEEIEGYRKKVEKGLGNSYTFYTLIRNRLLTTLLLYTGCRAQEAVSLTKQGIDYDKNTITLLTKGNKYNSIPIHDNLHQALEVYQQDYRYIDETLKGYHQMSPYLFPSKKDPEKHLATRTLHDLMKKYEKLLERHMHAHIFRHTFASYCIASNMDISTISSLISHSNPAITLSIYTHEIESNQKHKEMKKLSFQPLEV